MFKWLYGPILIAKADQLGTYASALAFCFVLSLVPFLAVTFAVGMQVSSHLALKDKDYAKQYAEVLRQILPMENSTETRHILIAVGAMPNPELPKDAPQRSKSGFLVTLGFILALYTSFSLMDQIIRTLLFIFDDHRKPREWSWKVVVKGFALLGIWMCLLLLISVSAIGTTGLQVLLNKFLFPSLSNAVVAAVQISVVIGSLFGTMYLTYYMVPTRHYKKQYVVEGSLLASTGWIVCSLIFATVVPNLLKASAAYAALGSVVGILIWAQACAWSIILGACWIVRFSPPRVKVPR